MPRPRLLLLSLLTTLWLWPAPLAAQTDTGDNAAESATGSGAEEVASRPGGMSEALWRELVDLDARIDEVQTLRARFHRHRRTPLLREPLVSEGAVYVQDGNTRWDTHAPSPSTTLVRGGGDGEHEADGEVWIYQPEERRAEVYALDERAEGFGGGPLPRLTRLADAFDVERAAADALFDDLDDVELEAAGTDGDGDLLALRLTPRDADAPLAEEIEELAMLIERERGRLVRLRIRSGPRQWTEYRFFDLEVDVDLPAELFTLSLPEDVTVVRPMER